MYWFRRVRLVALLGSIGVVGVLSVSDRAPALVGAVGRSVFVLASRVDPFGTVGAAAAVAMNAGHRTPSGIDTIGHFGMWAAVAFVATGLVATSRQRWTMLSSLFLLSALFEAAQQYLSWSRQASLDDLVANGFGVVFGYLCFSLVERLALPRLRALGGLRSRLGLIGSGGAGSLR